MNVFGERIGDAWDLDGRLERFVRVARRWRGVEARRASGARTRVVAI